MKRRGMMANWERRQVFSRIQNCCEDEAFSETNKEPSVKDGSQKQIVKDGLQKQMCGGCKRMRIATNLD